MQKSRAIPYINVKIHNGAKIAISVDSIRSVAPFMEEGIIMFKGLAEKDNIVCHSQLNILVAIDEAITNASTIDASGLVLVDVK